MDTPLGSVYLLLEELVHRERVGRRAVLKTLPFLIRLKDETVFVLILH